jgi:redox-sensitive bicupin YhaK (pirin superfamily)
MSAVELIISGKKKDLGDGFTVARVLPYAKRRRVGPFVFFDEMGPAQFPNREPALMCARTPISAWRP